MLRLRKLAIRSMFLLLKKATLSKSQLFQKEKASRVWSSDTASAEDLEHTVRSTQSENQVLSEEVFETKFQRKCEWPAAWVEIASR
jgi:hypothetical protein